MKIIDRDIDSGKPFDWGRTSLDYAKFRDIYPNEFYQRILERKLCLEGQSILDIGTGTGVLPRNMYQYGAKWTAADISENQINSFDVITACQCFWYFNHEIVMPKFYHMLRPGGKYSCFIYGMAAI